MTTVARIRWVLAVALFIWIASGALLYRRYRTGDVEKRGGVTMVRREMRMDPRTGELVEMPWVGSRQFTYLVMLSLGLLVATVVTTQRIRKRAQGGPAA